MKVNEKNARLNNEEYHQKKVVLKSYPQTIFVQMDAPCNHDCLFCSRPETYSYFDLDSFRRNFEELLHPVFMRANQINLTGSGELLSLPEAKRNLDYFNSYPHAEKMFAANGTFLTKKMIDYIVKSGNRYLIHVSLHASEASLHREMTGRDNFSNILNNLKYLRRVKEKEDNLQYNFIFVATGKNISNLKDFIQFAVQYNADAVIVYYNYIYRLDQKKLSCYFAQEQTNRVISEVERLKNNYENEIRIDLPPKFNKRYEPEENLCSEAWTQTMVNMRGDVISCDVAGDSYESIKGKSDFMQVWNGSYYRNLREKLVKKEYDCASFCWRADRNTVNDFKSHVITRGKSSEELEEFFKGVEK